MTCEIEKTTRGQFKLILKLYWPISYHIIYGIKKLTPYVLPVIKKTRAISLSSSLYFKS